MHRPLRVHWRTLWLALLCGVGTAGVGAQVAEQDLKVAYVFNFVQFIEWPAEAASAGRDFILCVAPFSALKRPLTALEGKRTTTGQTVRLQLLEVATLRECRVLVLDAGDAGRVSRALHGLPEGHGVLTIADGAPALPEAVITLAQQGGAVVFSVNLDAASKAGLQISSRLLRLSRSPR